MPKSKENRLEHRGFGFVTFETDAAIKRVVGAGCHRLRGATIAIDIAMPKEAHAVNVNSGGGVNGGGGMGNGGAGDDGGASAAAAAAAAAAFDQQLAAAGLGAGGMVPTPGFDAAAAAVAGLAAARQLQAAQQMAPLGL